MEGDPGTNLLNLLMVFDGNKTGHSLDYSVLSLQLGSLVYLSSNNFIPQDEVFITYSWLFDLLMTASRDVVLQLLCVSTYFQPQAARHARGHTMQRILSVKDRVSFIKI